MPWPHLVWSFLSHPDCSWVLSKNPYSGCDTSSSCYTAHSSTNKAYFLTNPRIFNKVSRCLFCLWSSSIVSRGVWCLGWLRILTWVRHRIRRSRCRTISTLCGSDGCFRLLFALLRIFCGFFCVIPTRLAKILLFLRVLSCQSLQENGRRRSPPLLGSGHKGFSSFSTSGFISFTMIHPYPPFWHSSVPLVNVWACFHCLVPVSLLRGSSWAWRWCPRLAAS